MVSEIAGGDSYRTVNGIRIHLHRAGRGEPLFLLHGLGGPLMWRRLIGPLAESHEVTSLDLPGFGDSECAPRRQTALDHSETLRELLDGAGIAGVSLAGISYGGQVAATFAFRHPARVRRLVLVCSTGLAEPGRLARGVFLSPPAGALIRASILRSRSLLCRFGARSFYDIRSRPPDLCERFFREISQRGKRAAWWNALKDSFPRGDEFRKALRAVEAPALVVWGENDRTVPPRYAEEFRNLLPRARVLMIPECAHSVPLEKPLRLAAAITEFLGEAQDQVK